LVGEHAHRPSGIAHRPRLLSVQLEIALVMTEDKNIRALTALTLARIGDASRAEKMIADLAKENPTDTVLNNAQLAVARAALELQRTQPARAVEALEHEASQLPKSASAIVMLGVYSVPSAMKDWPPLLLRRLQPALNTRVSAICLFTSASSSTPTGEGIVPETKVLRNPHAALGAPGWLLEQLGRTSGVPFGAELG